MSAGEALIILLPEEADRPCRWLRVAEGAVAQSGEGTDWLAVCGLAELPPETRVMLVPPAGLTVLHSFDFPSMPPRQASAAARLAALQASIGAADTLFAASDANLDPAVPHRVAVVARQDMQHWLLWAQHHGLDPDIILPAALLLPEPENGFARGQVGDAELLRGKHVALTADDPLAALLIGDAAVADVSPQSVTAALIDALDAPPLNLRQGEFARRIRRSLDSAQVKRIALWAGLIALSAVLIALITIARYHADADRLDAETVAAARKLIPSASDPERVEAEIDAQLSARGTGAYGFAGPAAALLTAIQGAPGVELTMLSRDAGGLLRARLTAANATEIEAALTALRGAGFTITSAPAQEPSGRATADITVQP